MHVDASAMVAIILGESDRESLVHRLDHADKRTTSAVAVLETVMAIGRETGDRSAGLPAVRNFLEVADIGIVPIGADLIEDLADAYLRYGKGSDSPARLNLGDCFSYAVAKKTGVPLLYKGNDFALTDLG
jgi:ribonuclease VapC